MLTRNQIILLALEDIGAYAPGSELPTPDEISSAALRLNSMIAEWQNLGIWLWLRRTLYLPAQLDTQSYAIGGTGSRCAATMVLTKLASKASQGATQIEVEDATGISDNDNIGVQLDSGLIQWTTVNGSPNGNWVSLDSSLSGDASTGNAVRAYTTAAPNIIGLYGVIASRDGTDTALSEIPKSHYLALPDKSTTGTTTSYTFEKGVSVSTLYVWPVESDTSTVFLLDAKCRVTALESANEEVQFPAEWGEALRFGLALRLAIPYRLDMQRIAFLTSMANTTLTNAIAADQEESSIFLVPDMRYY